MTSDDVLAILDKIAATGSRNEKEEILAEAIKDPLMKRVVKAACDSFITYGLKPKKGRSLGSHAFDMESEGVWDFLDRLASRELTGNLAKERLESMWGSLNPNACELLWRILSKDLRCGITAKTINAVLPGAIPVFEVMLSKVYEEKRIKSWPVAVEPKMDGMRAMILVKDGQARAFSRVGNHIPALDYLSGMIAQTVRNAMDEIAGSREPANELSEAYFRMLGGDHGNPTLAIDCEAISGESFYDGGVRRKSKDATEVMLHVFDAVPYKMLDRPEREIPLPFKFRRKFAEFTVACAPPGAPIGMTRLRLAHSHDEVMAITEDHWRAGLEGSMVKTLDGHYVKTKGHIWQKIKKEETEDLRITGWFEGEAGTVLEGKFGGFLVDREGVEVRVGGGFKAHEREEFEKLAREDYKGATMSTEKGKILYRGGEGTLVLGRLIEVEYHEVTPDGSLRHPRFIRFRNDKDERLRAA